EDGDELYRQSRGEASMILADAETLPSLLRVLENSLTTGSVYGLIAIGYTLVYGIIELINFAHGDVFMWGTAIVYFVLVVLFNIHGPVGNPFVMIGLVLGLMLVCMLACALMAILLERVAYRPLRRAPRLAPLISAIGASFVLENIALFFLGPSNQTVPNVF